MLVSNRPLASELRFAVHLQWIRRYFFRYGYYSTKNSYRKTGRLSRVILLGDGLEPVSKCFLAGFELLGLLLKIVTNALDLREAG